MSIAGWMSGLLCCLLSQDLIEFREICDASAAVWCQTGAERQLLVACDEDNILRFYPLTGGLPSQRLTNLDSFLQTPRNDGEVDLEGAATLGDYTFWLGSHGRNKNGKLRPARQQLFALKGTEPSGNPCRQLLPHLIQQFPQYRFAEASQKAPKEPGGLNLEGLAATTDGRLLLGFRNPIPAGKALIIPLENPQQVLQQTAPQFGAAIELPLQGAGIRDLAAWRDGYLILAGSYTGADEGGVTDVPFACYYWTKTKLFAIPLPKVDIRPEVILPWDQKALVLSDEGGVVIGSTECKDLPECERRFFGLWLDLAMVPQSQPLREDLPVAP